jgi:mono/diheme cytochrome c family protein
MNRLLGAVMMVGALAAPAWAQEVPKGDTANGKKVYLADGCYQCHGRVGQGGLMTGAAPILAQTKMPYAAFKRQLRSPINDMPPYPETLLSEKEVADIYGFLQALPGRRPVKDIPILNNNYN